MSRISGNGYGYGNGNGNGDGNGDGYGDVTVSQYASADNGPAGMLVVTLLQGVEP